MLTAQRVDEIFRDCLFRDEEIKREEPYKNGYAKGVGIVHEGFGFHQGRLDSHRAEIGTMLCELPLSFRAEAGGGMSFLNACERRDGVQWGEHRNMEQLFALGTATKQATLLMPREMWRALPGGMPYFAVNVPPLEPEPAAPAVQPVREEEEI